MANGTNTDNSGVLRDHAIFFALLAPTLNRVIGLRNLAVEKYPHDAAEWRLLFTHPKGGYCHVQVLRMGGEELGLFGAWNQNEYDSGTLRSYSVPKLETSRGDPAFEQKLHETIDNLIAHPLDEWTTVRSGHASDWHNLTKEVFDSLTDYPLVRKRT